MESLESSTSAASLALVGASILIAVLGTRLSRVADQLADLTGLGEAVFGAAFLGGATSLPGIVTSVTAAVEGHAPLAVSNAVGGIAAQTAFLAVADLSYRHANIEHASASIQNLMQGVLLIALLAVVLGAATGPPMAVLEVHPATVVLLLAYALGLRLTARTGRSPLWVPRHTSATKLDEPDPLTLRRVGMRRSWTEFAVLGLLVGAAGYVVARCGIALSLRTGLSETFVGGFLTAVSTSLPELVTCVAAARQGSPTLAIAGIIGGNSFDVLFVAVADIADRRGPLYAAIGPRQVFLIAMAMLSTAVLLLGLLRRERHGVANIGFESVTVLVLYGATFLGLFYAP